MRKRNGFTLVELLTVISIITILLAIIMPAINGVRKRAKATVCLSNLRQWGLVYKMYTDEFDGRLPRDYDGIPWYYPIKNYYSDSREILLCPLAKKTVGQKIENKRSVYGNTTTAWEMFSSDQEEVAWNSIGSYGLNSWTYKPEVTYSQEDMDITDSNGSGQGGTVTIVGGKVVIIGDSNSPDRGYVRHLGRRFRYGDGTGSGSGGGTGNGSGLSQDEENIINDINEISKPEKYFSMAYENHANKIPLVFDCSWLYSYLDDEQSPPSSEDSSRFTSLSNTTCINRHNGGINVLFMDFSSRKVGLKELWTLKWHKQYNTSGKWTKAGGVLPEKWPKWMRKYKDY